MIQQFNTLDVLQQVRKLIKVNVRFLIPLISTVYYRVFALPPVEKFYTVNVAYMLLAQFYHGNVTNNRLFCLQAKTS